VPVRQSAKRIKPGCLACPWGREERKRKIGRAAFDDSAVPTSEFVSSFFSLLLRPQWRRQDIPYQRELSFWFTIYFCATILKHILLA
jgi:hypothetical protein